ncbi:VOC family protein [Lichenibacterium ramalinae]|uniref:Glyoxalase n=1 Tax=Lichenibacterium ramalinae TaxID=2316527 RepID=A0A4Q2RFZ0_9HYPH|nr:VOC family protein [Lichenibacterium ramalinae]RYB07096.1 glyoxalase [Lichenibacterium ramalinae]
MKLAGRRVARIDFTAADLADTRRFYEALGFVAAAEPAPVDGAQLALLGVEGARAERLAMRLGAQEVGFLRFDPPGRPYPADSTSTDLWFQHIAIAVSDMAAAHAAALAAGAVPITRGGPQTLPPNTGSVTAFKFRDPDGHPLELLHFPDGTGAPAWHESAAAAPSPFLGIDHTAVSVSDPARSAAFFAGLGLTARDGSLNAGPEQERLDDVDGDTCRVVPLIPPEAPPHVELLGYRTGQRRPMPAGTRGDDIWATRVWIEVASLSGDGLTRAAALPGGLRAALVHDPDGHAVVLLENGEPA